jgi:hypothetical protein
VCLVFPDQARHHTLNLNAFRRFNQYRVVLRIRGLEANELRLAIELLQRRRKVIIKVRYDSLTVLRCLL